MFQVIVSFVLPHLKALGDRVHSALEGVVLNNADRIAADNIKKIVVVSYITCEYSFLKYLVRYNFVNSLYEYKDQPWFSVFKHSKDHEEGV